MYKRYEEISGWSKHKWWGGTDTQWVSQQLTCKFANTNHFLNQKKATKKHTYCHSHTNLHTCSDASFFFFFTKKGYHNFTCAFSIIIQSFCQSNKNIVQAIIVRPSATGFEGFGLSIQQCQGWDWRGGKSLMCYVNFFCPFTNFCCIVTWY